jgi:hypothetical protein
MKTEMSRIEGSTRHEIEATTDSVYYDSEIQCTLRKSTCDIISSVIERHELLGEYQIADDVATVLEKVQHWNFQQSNALV